MSQGAFNVVAGTKLGYGGRGAAGLRVVALDKGPRSSVRDAEGAPNPLLGPFSQLGRIYQVPCRIKKGAAEPVSLGTPPPSWGRGTLNLKMRR